ncbi:hypothetical protein BFW38_07960 [Terasakiispira papahanaumokuakeensis]|uniref:5-carboxymethyl-2-hydroxymuconate isomerase n=1 Tax=Terasakiispira papahanaumokuakeensis TaxID=197479 RepID=A0A1E2V904_9GAMM|nr:5-carboxymethyl-2-hydroxymuconate Delta-isomerase [Terasakiispira papahanaumokuakeensis]ODC03490.1 hypothetical protein BFW38_07960 [Terasakiispira papahanaumokuakeensis]
MPHCIIEYSRSLEQQGEPAVWVDTVFQSVLDSGIAPAAAIKVRGIGYDHYRIGEPADDFLHVSLRLLPGRTPEIKQQLTARVLEQLKQLGLSHTAISVEICEMEAESYVRSTV